MVTAVVRAETVILSRSDYQAFYLEPSHDL